MAFNKIANAEIVDVISLQNWEKMHGNRAFGNKTASTMQKLADEHSKFLLSHCTIMSSVMTEDAPEDYLIKPECSYLVNNNEDAWSNEVIRLSYKTFVGAFNFLEHFQSSKSAKGHILDAILRKVKMTPTVWVYYVDILVATDLVHEKLVADIHSGKTKYMSMGCTTDLVVCSFCGAHCAESYSFCEHLMRNKGEYLMDDAGIPRRVAELCGHKSLPNGGVKFVEASWVGTPAFPGAALGSIVTDSWLGPKTPFTYQASLAATKFASTSSCVPLHPDNQQRALLRHLLR
jgi:hypothetical protein